MSRRAIDRRDWAAFADAFSRRHEGWLVSVAVEKEGRERDYLFQDMPLRGVVAEQHDRNESVIFLAGGTEPHWTHFVEEPSALLVEETEEGAEVELIVVDQTGVRTSLTFRSPMPPELVDGLVR